MEAARVKLKGEIAKADEMTKKVARREAELAEIEMRLQVEDGKLKKDAIKVAQERSLWEAEVVAFQEEKKKFSDMTTQFEKRRKQVLEQAKALLERDAAG